VIPRKKILAVVGARPQFIKHAPLSKALEKDFLLKSVHTGQHYDDNMSRIFFDELKIQKPDFQLKDIGKSHAEQTGNMLISLERIFQQEQPDAVLVYGDTNSTLSAALAAVKLHIQVIHIEAGLRSFNIQMPEEVNRIMTDHVSSILFCPSEVAQQNLFAENIRRNVFICGDVMKDMLRLTLPYTRRLFQEKKYYFATIHRPYNTDAKDRMLEILNTFNALPYPVLFPIHPRTTKLLAGFGVQLEQFKNISFIEPVGYFESLSYQYYCEAIITDSGGVQKEAYWLEKKCITIRPETEWVETLTNHCNTLLFDSLSELASKLQEIPTYFDPGLYGTGDASNEISEQLKNCLC
jgi:UDP-GlcNAc3NAcA epimerase